MSSSHQGKSLTLKYRFLAFFEDGHIIEQGKDDQSTIDPLKSAFFDVLEYEKTSRLVSFRLFKVDDSSHPHYDVNLLTGQFSTWRGGYKTCFDIAEQNFEQQAPLRLVYFRETRLDSYIGNKTGKPMGSDFYINKYYLGFQTTWKNKNYQCTISIDGK